jgi:glycerate kinase
MPTTQSAGDIRDCDRDADHDQRTVVIAPDSFKGSISAAAAAEAIATGWRSVRDHDRLILMPLADGGEGTVDAIATARPDGVLHEVPGLTGPDLRPVTGHWLQLGERTAVVEMAEVSGLPLMRRLDPLGATTVGLGELLSAVLDAGMTQIIVGAGGSATTDGGSGALSALGLELLDASGRPIPPGGGGLRRLARIQGAARRPAKLIMLSDVDAPLLGPRGAAAVFGPQKGADSEQIAVLDAALEQFAGLLGQTLEQAGGAVVDRPGMGAAGGLGFGLVAGLGAEIRPGAAYLCELAGLGGACDGADLVITGEGRFDQTSLGGKVVGHVLDVAESYQTEKLIIAGQVAQELPGIATLGLVDLAGSTAEALADPVRWLTLAGARAAAMR